MPTATPIKANWITVHEAARIIGVTHSMVTRYIHSGRLTASRIGNQLFVLRSEAEKYERERPGRTSKNFQNS